jgi:hypothetical protein
MCVQSQAPQIWQVLAPSLLVLLTYICEFAFCHCPLIVIALTISKQTMFSALQKFFICCRIMVANNCITGNLHPSFCCKSLHASEEHGCSFQTMFDAVYVPWKGCIMQGSEYSILFTVPMNQILLVLGNNQTFSLSWDCYLSPCPYFVEDSRAHLKFFSKIDSSIFGILLCSLGHWMGCINEALRCFEI